MTPEERLSLAELDPEFKLFIQQNPPPPPPVPEIGFFRRMGEARLAEIVSTLGPAPEEVTEKEVQIPTRDGSVINAWVVSPRSIPASGAPIVVWFHGGGFCIGDGREELSTARSFAIHAAVVTICVSYRLAPEHKFPTAIHDGQDALEWVIKSRDSLQVNLQLGFVVGGVSAGANIAAVLAHMARDLGLSPPLTGQILSVPPLLPESEVEEKHRNRLLSSTQEMGEGFLSPEVIKLFNDSYAADTKSPLYTAFKHPAGHADLPPLYIQVCGLDPLRDEDLLYEEILREEYYLKTRKDVYKGLPHHFWSFFPALSASKKHADDTVEGLKWLLLHN